MRITFFILLFLCFISCDSRKEVKALEDQVMAVHDEAMKEMAVMERKGRELKKELAALDTLAEAGKARKQVLVPVLAQMANASADMSAWMQSYKSPGDELPVKEAVMYLTEQKRLMDANLEAMKAWKTTLPQ
jgi:D-lyxose ketol-isomerase